MPLEPLVKKWGAFNFKVIEIDGHNISNILEALSLAGKIHNQPITIIAHTIKGKGVSFMENKAEWHGIPPNDEQLRLAKEELIGGLKIYEENAW
jgi:transketolase